MTADHIPSPAEQGLEARRIAAFRVWLRPHVQFAPGAGTNAHSVYDTVWEKVVDVFGDGRKGDRRVRSGTFVPGARFNMRNYQGRDRRQTPQADSKGNQP